MPQYYFSYNFPIEADSEEAAYQEAAQYLKQHNWDAFASNPETTLELWGEDEDDEFMAMTRWHRDDIKSIRPHWSLEKCSEALSAIEDRLSDCLVEEGWSRLEILLSDWEDEQKNY